MRYSLIVLAGLGLCPPQSLHAANPPITAMAFAPNAPEVLVGSQQGLRRLSYPKLEPRGTLPTKLTQIHSLAFSPDGKLLAIGGGTPGEAGIIELWSWPDRKKIRSLSPHGDVIYTLAWNQNSTWLVSGAHDGEIIQTEALTGKILQNYSGHSQPVRTVCLVSNDKTLVSAGHDQTLRVWETKTGRLTRSLHNHTKPVSGLAARPQRPQRTDELPLVASIGADRTVRLWQPTIGRMVRFLRLTSAAPLAVAWSQDARALLVTDTSGKLHFINPETLAIQKTLAIAIEWPTCLTVSPSSSEILVGGSDSRLQRCHAEPHLDSEEEQGSSGN